MRIRRFVLLTASLLAVLSIVGWLQKQHRDALTVDLAVLVMHRGMELEDRSVSPAQRAAEDRRTSQDVRRLIH